MLSIFGTGHLNRTINVVSQRVGNIDAMIRGNVNRFFKCEKVFDFAGIKLFRRSEYQDVTSDERPDEEKDPISTKYYFGTKYYFRLYDSKYMRGGLRVSQPLHSGFFRVRWADRLRLLLSRKNLQTPPHSTLLHGGGLNPSLPSSGGVEGD